MKFANEIEGIKILGPVGRFGRIKYFIQSQILKRAIGAPKRCEQLKEEGARIKTKKDINNSQKDDLKSRIEATGEQKRETVRLGKQAAERQEEMVDAKSRPVVENERGENK